MRRKKPIAIIDAYYDGEGKALCPAATGISHHINPWGDIEPCPIVQFSTEAIHRDGPHHGTDDRPLKEKFLKSRVPVGLPQARSKHDPRLHRARTA